MLEAGLMLDEGLTLLEGLCCPCNVCRVLLLLPPVEQPWRESVPTTAEKDAKGKKKNKKRTIDARVGSRNPAQKEVTRQMRAERWLE